MKKITLYIEDVVDSDGIKCIAIYGKHGKNSIKKVKMYDADSFSIEHPKVKITFDGVKK